MSELELAQQYHEFYSTTTVDSTILYSTITYKNQEQDQNFLLTRLLSKVQRFTKANPHLTEKFVNSIGTILELEIKTIELNQQPSDDKINNPLIAKTKGASKKRKTSDIEKQVSKKSKSINKQEQITTNKENKQEKLYVQDVMYHL